MNSFLHKGNDYQPLSQLKVLEKTRKYYIFHPFDDLHKIWINSFIYYLKENNIEYENTDKNDINCSFFLNLKKSDNNLNHIFLYITHPINMINDINILSIKDYLNKINIKKILYITEPLTFLIYKKTYSNIIKNFHINELWTYSYGNIIYYKPIYNINFYVKPILFNNIINFIKDFDINNEFILEKRKKNINKIIFLGNINEERKKILNMFGENLIVKNNVWSFDEFKDLFENYTYFLNIHRNKNCICFESFRNIPILSNYGFILCENINEKEENEYKDFNIIFEKKENIYQKWKQIIDENKNETYVLQNLKKIKDKCLLFRNYKNYY